MENKELIIGCINRDEHAFRELVDNYIDFAFSVAFRILNDEEESNDVVQESFITVWEKIGGFNSDKNFSNWLYRIIVNRCYDVLRTKKRTSLVYPDENDWNIPLLFSESNSEMKLNNEEIGKTIRLLTQRLSHKQKVVFILIELQGLSQDEVAEITGMGKATVKSNLNHARRNIGKMLEKYL